MLITGGVLFTLLWMFVVGMSNFGQGNYGTGVFLVGGSILTFLFLAVISILVLTA